MEDSRDKLAPILMFVDVVGCSCFTEGILVSSSSSNSSRCCCCCVEGEARILLCSSRMLEKRPTVSSWILIGSSFFVFSNEAFSLSIFRIISSTHVSSLSSLSKEFFVDIVDLLNGSTTSHVLSSKLACLRTIPRTTCTGFEYSGADI